MEDKGWAGGVVERHTFKMVIIYIIGHYCSATNSSNISRVLLDCSLGYFGLGDFSPLECQSPL